MFIFVDKIVVKLKYVGNNRLTSTTFQVKLALDHIEFIFVTPEHIHFFEVTQVVMREKFNHPGLAHTLELSFVFITESLVLNIS